MGQIIPKDLDNSSFNQAFSSAQQSTTSNIQVSDFKPYGPSGGDPAAFTIKPVISNGKRIGYIAYQQPIDKINSILTNKNGMGETGGIIPCRAG